MIHAKKELDLLRSYRRLMRGEKGRSSLLHHFLTPAAGCLLVCVLIWGVLLWRNSSLSRRTDDVNDWLSTRLSPSSTARRRTGSSTTTVWCRRSDRCRR